MAPRRGGFGGGGVSVQSCDSYAFSTATAKIYVAFYAFFFILFIILYCVGLSSSRDLRKHNGKLWGPLSTSVWFAIVAQAIWIIFLSLNECDIDFTFSNYLGNVLGNWVAGLSDWLLLFTIMVPICKQLQQATGHIQKGRYMLNTAWAVLAFIVYIATTALYTAALVLNYEYEFDTYEKIAPHLQAMWVVLDTFLIVGVLIACVDLIGGLRSEITSQGRNRSVWIWLLIISSLVHYVFPLVSYVRSAYIGSNNIQEYEALFFVSQFFYAVAIFSAIRVGNSLAMAGLVESSGVPSSTVYSYQPALYEPPSQPHVYSPQPQSPDHYQSGFSNTIR